jgi:hypothetical protein
MKRHVISEYKKHYGKNNDRNIDDVAIYRQMKYLTEEQESLTKLVRHINYRNIVKYPTLYNCVPSNKVILEEDTTPKKIKAKKRKYQKY